MTLKEFAKKLDGHEYGHPQFTKEEIAIAKENGVELAILQSRSPSCGVKEIYDGTFSGTKIPGQGVFAKMLMDEGIRVLDAGELPKIILKNEDGKCQSD